MGRPIKLPRLCQCEGKTRFRSKADARKFLRQRYGTRMVIYPCPWCGWIHTAHSEEGKVLHG